MTVTERKTLKRKLAYLHSRLAHAEDKTTASVVRSLIQLISKELT